MKRITATLAALAVAAGLTIAATPSAQAAPSQVHVTIPDHGTLTSLCLERVGRKHHKRWVVVRCAPVRTVPIPQLPVYGE